MLLLAINLLTPSTESLFVDALINTMFFIMANSVLFSLAYRILPWEQPSFGARLQGALMASVLLSIVRVLVVFYLSLTPVPGLFEAAGVMIVLLLWLYATASVFFFGAAIAHVLHQQPPKNSDTIPNQ